LKINRMNSSAVEKGKGSIELKHYSHEHQHNYNELDSSVACVARNCTHHKTPVKMSRNGLPDSHSHSSPSMTQKRKSKNNISTYARSSHVFSIFELIYHKYHEPLVGWLFLAMQFTTSPTV
jgi:hypothetical protein